MIVAVPAGLLASPLKGGRDLGDHDRSALVVGGTDRVRTHDGVVFCKVVVVAGKLMLPTVATGADDVSDPKSM